MTKIIFNIETDPVGGLSEFCVGVYDGDIRLEHKDYILNREQLWNLKQEVDNAWFGVGVDYARFDTDRQVVRKMQ